MTNLLRPSLRLRVAVPLGLSLAFLAAIVLLTWWRLGAAELANETNARREAVFLLERLQDVLADPLLAGDRRSANRVVAGFGLHEAVRLLVVVDDTDSVVIGAGPSLRGQQLENSLGQYASFLSPAIREQTQIGLVALPGEPGQFLGYAPIQLEPRPGVLRPSRSGMIVIRFDFCLSYAASRADTRRDVLVTTSALLTIAVLLGLFLSWRLTRPVEAVATAVKRLAGGDMTSRVSYRGTCEIGELAKAFNHMADTLAEDRTQLVAYQAQLEDQNQRLSDAARRQHLLVSALEESPTAVVILDPERHRITYANRTFVEMMGIGTLDPIDRPLRVVCGRESDDNAFERIDAALAGRNRIDTQLRLHRANGTTFWTALSIGPVLGPENEMLAFVGCFIDITLERRQHENLRHLQKMEALGQLAGGIAHEINNLLQPILTFTSLTRRVLPPDSPGQAHLAAVQTSCRRAKEIIRNVLTFARGSNPQVALIDLRAAVEEAHQFARDLLPPTVSVTIRLCPGPVPAYAGNTELTQILLNLLANARDAMADHGTVVVELRLCTVTSAMAEELKVAPGRFAVLEVTDDGPGMDEDTRRQCLDPFFSTKSVDRGTGLGLSVVLGILQSWGGGIGISSVPGCGARFSLYVPIAEENAFPPAPIPRNSTPPRRRSLSPQ